VLKDYGDSIKEHMDDDEKLCLRGDKGYVFVETPDDSWKLCITKSGESEKQRGSAQTNSEQEDPYDQDANKEREFSTEYARGRAVVERTIGLIKKWRLLSSGMRRFGDHQPLAQSYVFIAAYFANLLIEGGHEINTSE
jgi:hypothetical protein